MDSAIPNAAKVLTDAFASKTAKGADDVDLVKNDHGKEGFSHTHKHEHTEYGAGRDDKDKKYSHTHEHVHGHDGHNDHKSEFNHPGED